MQRNVAIIYIYMSFEIWFLKIKHGYVEEKAQIFFYYQFEYSLCRDLILTSYVVQRNVVNMSPVSFGVWFLKIKYGYVE